ncbi:MAG: hypothetical protein ABI368_04380 [Jatrophihabitantaceae bacterium]
MILIAVLVVPLFLVMLASDYIGLLGIVGAVRLARCDHCGHFGLTAAREELQTCARCRHERLLHPLVALHHAR